MTISSPDPQSTRLDPAHRDALDRAATSIKLQLANPGAESPRVISAALQLLGQVPQGVAPARRIDCLLDIAQYFYVSGQAFAGLKPSEDAVRVARASADPAVLRRSLSTLGILQADTGNCPGAISSFAEALDIATARGDVKAEAATWNNLGLALLYAAQYQEAIDCFERAVALSEQLEALALIRSQALGNIALASLHVEDYRRGLRAAKRSVETIVEPKSAIELFSRVLHETHYSRLLLEVDNLDRAKERCELAKRYAKLSHSERAQLEADIAEGLYEVHAGLVDMGLSRLHQALERARLQKSALRDALIAMVKAHEVVGQPDRALTYLRELMLHTRKMQQDNVLQHHRRHLAQMEQDQDQEPTETQVDVLRRREILLRGQMAERELVESRRRAEQDLMKSRIEMLERLAVTAELRDDSTGEHSYRVGRLSALLAAEYGCDDGTIFMVDLAARLHDIGKIGIPDGILLKPGKLNPAERQIMETHTTVGAELLAQSEIPHLQMAEEIARHHHEWWDGSGYPTGISGKAIPIGARIAALADVFDALTHKRPYKEPWPVAHALAEIESLKGRQFDPELTDLFTSLVRKLQREQGDLDLYLGQSAQASPFVQARKKIALALHRSTEDRLNGFLGLAGVRFDVQR